MTGAEGPSSDEVGYDFSDEPEAVTQPPPEPVILDYDPAKDRESMRGFLAGGLTLVFGFVVIAAVIVGIVSPQTEVDSFKSVLESILPPVVALTGTAMGFYFGGQASGGADTGGGSAASGSGKSR